MKTNKTFINVMISTLKSFQLIFHHLKSMMLLKLIKKVCFRNKKEYIMNKKVYLINKLVSLWILLMVGIISLIRILFRLIYRLLIMHLEGKVVVLLFKKYCLMLISGLSRSDLWSRGCSIVWEDKELPTLPWLLKEMMMSNAINGN